ncbi:MAG: outer membrane beta-barrel domain-containing protein [Nitrospirae bacterium]|nr:outer membrane beta-barrel domain-containing protein [Nitrospirota bacterium]
MRIIFKFIAVAIIMLLTALPNSSAAENKAGAVTFNPNIGGYVFGGDQDIKNSLVYGLGLGYNLTENWGVEGNFNYVNTKSKLAGKEDVEAYLYRIDGLYHFMPDKKFVPYLALGMGAITINGAVKDDGTDPLLNYGGGIKYFLNQNFAIRGDVRHIIVKYDNEFKNLIYTMGLTYMFGGEEKKEAVPPAPAPSQPKDSDGDGVYDEMDKCPDTPKGVVVDMNGCPRDSDGDGVPDYLDKCPDTPKGVTVDMNGCPRDSDGDGVPDYLDKCPDTPIGAPVDSVGCPNDSDGDGVYDYLDKCPGTPKGIKVDISGCPIPITEKVSVELHVEFDTGSAAIKSVYEDNMQKVANFLKAYPGTEAVIEGHTDNVGGEQYNLKLSQRRSESVMQQLIKEYGIDPSRLKAKGFGKSQPIADNNTKEGKQKNRRVVAVISTTVTK